jgi:signal transduction histidine kinase/CheY-like chemotaxis protein
LSQSSSYIVLAKLPLRLGQLVMLAALLVLTGWVFHIAVLKSILPDFVVMNPTTAVLFAFCGGALWLTSMHPNHNPRATDIINWIIIIIAVTRLAGFHPRFDTGIDQFLFPDQLHENRMAPNTALNFFLSGISLWLCTHKIKYHFLLSQILAVIALSISLLAVIGYLYVDHSLYRVATYIPMALHTAVTFLLLTLGILFASGEHGFMSVIMHKNIGGKISRILLPITLLIPMILGWLRLEGQRKGLFALEFGTALLTIATIMIFTLLIWGLSWSINLADEKRKKAELATLSAKLEAEDAKKVQEQFLANMSHEIRTPINGVIGMTQLIQGTELNREQKEYFNVIIESASNLLVIINDILDVTKMKAGKILLEDVPYSLRDMSRTLIKIFKLKAAQKDISLNCEIDSRVPEILSGDPVRLNQILINLLNNAIKFTEKGGVDLNIQLLREDDATVTIQFDIRDTGIGIGADKILSVFESFTQASNETTRKYGGTGLGLTISKQLIEMQGGEISVSSIPGTGSTFSFYLTIKRAAKETILHEKNVSQDNGSDSLSNLKILLAEDNLINQVVASKLLSKRGAEVDIANNGREVIEKLALKEYRIILMDIQMPEMDGLETTEFIRNSGASFARIPIIALTASALVSEKSKCFEAGMDDYLSKPFKAEELFEKVSSWSKIV